MPLVMLVVSCVQNVILAVSRVQDSTLVLLHVQNVILVVLHLQGLILVVSHVQNVTLIVQHVGDVTLVVSSVTSDVFPGEFLSPSRLCCAQRCCVIDFTHNIQATTHGGKFTTDNACGSKRRTPRRPLPTVVLHMKRGKEAGGRDGGWGGGQSIIYIMRGQQPLAV